MVTDYASAGFLFHAPTGQVLLHHRDANTPYYPQTWAGFGGRSEPEDRGDPVSTWRREMREELGIELAPSQITPLRSYVNTDVGRLRYIFYAAWLSLDDDFVLAEGDGYAWFPLDEAIELPDLMVYARGDLIFLRDTIAQSTAASAGSGSEPVARQNGHAVDLRQELYLIADELRGVATLGKRFAATVYETERSDQIMGLASRVASLADEASLDEVAAIFGAEGWLRISPAIGVDAFVFNERGEILLLRRRDNDHWCMPGGFAEIGQSTSEAVLRELWEEAGLRGEVQRLLGVFDGPRWGSRSKVHMLHLVYLVQCAELNPVPGIEMLEARFFSPDALPEPMFPGHAPRVPVCVEMARSGRTYADPATTYGVDLPLHQRPGHGG